MAARVGTTQSGGGGTTTSRSWSHTLVGTADRVLNIFLYTGDSRVAVSAITVDSVDVSAYFVGDALHATWGGSVRHYCVPGLVTGARAIAVTYAGGGCENWYASDEAEDVDQSSPARDADFVQGGSSGGTVGPTIDSDTTDLVLVAGVADSITLTTPGSQTSLYNDGSSDGKGLSWRAGDSPTVAGQYTIPGGPFADYAVYAVSLQSPAGGGDVESGAEAHADASGTVRLAGAVAGGAEAHAAATATVRITGTVAAGAEAGADAEAVLRLTAAIEAAAEAFADVAGEQVTLEADITAAAESHADVSGRVRIVATVEASAEAGADVHAGVRLAATVDAAAEAGAQLEAALSLVAAIAAAAEAAWATSTLTLHVRGTDYSVPLARATDLSGVLVRAVDRSLPFATSTEESP